MKFDSEASQHLRRDARRGQLAPSSTFRVDGRTFTGFAGDTIASALIAAGRLDAYKFKAERVGESSFEGRPTLQIKVALDSLLGVFVDPLIVEYDRETRQLKQYRGIGNMQQADGKVYPVRVSYHRQPPAEARAAVDAAQAAQAAEPSPD